MRFHSHPASRPRFMRRLAFHVVFLLFAFAFAPAFAAQAQAHAAGGRPLLIYSIDVEGGQSTLIVSPSGTSLLVDAGWPDNNGRDVQRIQAAMRDAHIARIDHVLVTHYHDDHVGGVPNLVRRVSAGEFLDHGENREDSAATRANYAAYLKAIQGHPRRILHPGDTISIPGLDAVVLTADGQHVARIPGVTPRPNAYCAAEPKWPADPSENARSMGILLTFGRFRFLDLGDLTGAQEIAMVCPANPIPPVDLFLVSHHGMNLSNSRALVDAIHPRVAIMNNGARKGGSPEAWERVHQSPGLKDMWQLHTAEGSGAAHNSPSALIANPAGAPDSGHWIKVEALANGSFSVTNQRTGETRRYPRP